MAVLLFGSAAWATIAKAKANIGVSSIVFIESPFVIYRTCAEFSVIDLTGRRISGASSW